MRNAIRLLGFLTVTTTAGCGQAPRGGPACTPRTCAASASNCGTMPDGCGGTVACGSCPTGQTCGGGGTANVCGAGSCAPTTCAALGTDCGVVSDGCSSTLSCGDCNPGQTCGGGGTANVCGSGSNPGSVRCAPLFGATVMCASGQVCCESTSGQSCAGSASACPQGSAAYACDGPEDCAGRPCCSLIQDYPTGSACSATSTCSTGSALCHSANDCAPGQACLSWYCS